MTLRPTPSPSHLPAPLRPATDSLASRLRCAGSRPRLQALHLLWSLWVFSTPLFLPVGTSYVYSLLLSYPLFLLLFFLVHVRPYREMRLYAAAMTALALVCMPFNPPAWGYAVFACAYVPITAGEPLRRALWRMALIELAVVAWAWWMHWPWLIIAMIVGVCSSAGCGSLIGRVNAIKTASERMSREEVRRLAASAERERIGRDLHDLLGHTLSLITLKLELSRKLFDRDPEAARNELAEAEKVARHALGEVRAAVTGIRATGLAGELASARLMLRSSGVELATGIMPSLPGAIDDTLALVLRESVTNIHRHAQARHAGVDIHLDGGRVVMQVRDDGRGGVSALGNGLRGMRERVEALSGTLRVTSRSGQGTLLRIEIPLPAAETEDSGADERGWPVPALDDSTGSHA